MMKKTSFFLCAFLIVIGLTAPAGSAAAKKKNLKALKKEAVQEVGKLQDFSQQMVDMIFSFGELGFQEFETSGYITTILRDHGFEVKEGVSGMPTAWFARW